jgi:hypothetical protein
MGLMDFLEPFATGFLETRVNQMETLAQEKADKRKLEDKLKLENLYGAQALKKQYEIEEEFNIKEENRLRGNVTTDLLGQGMSQDLIDLLPYSAKASPEAYGDFVTNSYGGDANWFKKPKEMPDGSTGTIQSFILLANDNQNNINKNKLNKNLTSDDGPMSGLDNSANALLEDEKPQFADFSTFIEQPKQVAEQVAAMEEPAETETTISDDVPAFSGLGTAEDFFEGYSPLSEKDVRERDKQIVNAVGKFGGFGEALKFVNGEYVIQGFGVGQEQEQTRFNALVELAEKNADVQYNDTGVSPTGQKAVLEALQDIDFITEIATTHKTKDFMSVINNYPVLEQALKLGVIDENEAFQAMRYEDFRTLEAADLGFQAKKYYSNVSGLGYFMPEPAFYKDLQERIDDELVGRIDEFDAQGELLDDTEQPDPNITIEFTSGDQARLDSLLRRKNKTGLTNDEEIELKKLQADLSKVKPKNVDVVSSDELKYNTLLRRKNKRGLTNDEEIEFDELKIKLGK